MSDQTAHRPRSKQRDHLWSWFARKKKTGGQALVEYVLILTLVTIAIIAVLAITGPAVGNVFSNAVFNLLGGTVEPRDTLEADDFWTQVAAVASYTPENPSLITNTPAPATSTPTVGPSSTPTPITPSPQPTSTNTPGPSPTPPDQNFGYPFEDPGENPDWWQHDFGDVFIYDWNAKFWDLSSTNGASYQPNMSTMPDGTQKWSTTYAVLDNYWSDSPGGGVTSNFYARFRNVAALENRQYTLRVRKDDGARVWVGGVLLVDKWAWSQSYDNWIEVPFTPTTAGENEVVVEMFDNGWGARAHVFIVDPAAMEDTGDCNWAVSTEAYRSSPSAWSDSPGANYSAYSRCIMALRGYIDLRGSTNPKLEFWDRYDLAYARAYVGVAVLGTSNWTDVQLHYYETDLGWTRQSFNLSNFGDPDGPGPVAGRDFSNEIIEIRFILDNSSSSSTDDGWWIDDISVKEEFIKRYTVGFSDDMEGESHWYAGGSWARSNEAVHSGENAWSDSPGGNYTHGTNNVLELDGIVDLTNAAVIEPEAVFWHRFDLTYNDSVYIEVSTDNRYSWTVLTGGPLAYRETNWSWNQVVVSLHDYIGMEIYLRFRIDARNSSSVADGWWIDDFSLRNKPETVITPQWCDNMEAGGSEWIPEGTWSIVNGPDYNPDQPYDITTMPHSGSQYWSDSPGRNYLDDTNSALVLRSKLDLSGTSGPEMVFWHQWDLQYSDDLYVEVSADDGRNWNVIWTYQYNNLPTGYRYVVDRGYNHIRSWTREAVSLRSYVGQAIKVRFRLDALYSSNVDDGWWIDDVCFQEHNEPVWRINTQPDGFRDGFELGDTNWYAGGTWTISPENKHAGQVAYSDSYGVSYQHESNAVLELRPVLDLTDTVEPTIYFWEAFNLQYNDYALVEINVSDDGGTTWNGWDEIYNQRYTTTTSWDRRQVGANLTSYIGKMVRLRFRLYAVYDTRVAEGWWIDDLWVVDRDGLEQTHPLPFTEDAEAMNDYWVMDGTWARMPMFRTIGSGSALGPGGWTGQYYSDDNRNRAFDPGELVFTRVDPEIDFDWNYDRPDSRLGVDYFMVRWTRTISVANDNTQYQIQAQSDDGIRVFVDGVRVINAWYDRGFPSTPDTADVTLDEGNHTVVVEYYERTGRAAAVINFGITGQVFHDSPAGDYFDDNDMSVTLEGVINLSGTSNPALSYWEKRYMGYGDVCYTEVSTDEGFTWTVVRSKAGTDSTWRKELIDLSDYAGQTINIRFRTDARSNWRVGDGWYIDDIIVAE